MATKEQIEAGAAALVRCGSTVDKFKLDSAQRLLSAFLAQRAACGDAPKAAVLPGRFQGRGLLREWYARWESDLNENADREFVAVVNCIAQGETEYPELCDHEGTPKAAAPVANNAVLAELIVAIDHWAAQEDGIPEEVFPSYMAVRTHLGWADDSGEQNARVIASLPKAAAPDSNDIREAVYAEVMHLCDDGAEAYAIARRVLEHLDAPKAAAPGPLQSSDGSEVQCGGCGRAVKLPKAAAPRDSVVLVDVPPLAGNAAVAAKYKAAATLLTQEQRDRLRFCVDHANAGFKIGNAEHTALLKALASVPAAPADGREASDEERELLIKAHDALLTDLSEEQDFWTSADQERFSALVDKLAPTATPAPVASVLEWSDRDYGNAADHAENAPNDGGLDGRIHAALDAVQPKLRAAYEAGVSACAAEVRRLEAQPTPAPVAAPKGRSARELADRVREMTGWEDIDLAPLNDLVALAEQKQAVPPAVAEVLAEMHAMALMPDSQLAQWANTIEASLAGRLEGEAGDE